MTETLSLTLIPVCRSVSDPTWLEPACQAVQHVLENKNLIIKEAYRATGREYDPELLESWPDTKEEMEDLLKKLQASYQIRLTVEKNRVLGDRYFEDEVQLLAAFGRVVCEYSLRNNMLISSVFEYQRTN